MSRGIKRMYLRDITPSTSDDYFLVGIVIAKQSPRSFPSKRDNTERSVCNFTFRDSPSHYVNIAIWGSSDYVNYTTQQFHIGDVVDVISPKANFNRSSEQESKFQPAVTCPFTLTLNEKFSNIKMHALEDCAQFLPLLRLPTQPPTDFLLLQDIHANSQALCGKFINILVAVQSLNAVRQITTKEGKLLESREITVIDQSHSKLYVQLWDADNAYRAENWLPRETVLFIANLRVDWNEYKKAMTGTVTSRTIITENPSTTEANALKNFARTAPVKPRAVLTQLATNYPDPNSITNIMSCRSVWEKAMTGGCDNFTALVYAALHDFDIDGLKPVSVTKCKYCGLPVSEETFTCVNFDCPVQSSGEMMQCETMFDVTVKIADHTGSLNNCRLIPSVTESLLRCNVTEFESLPDEKRTLLKWEYLLQQCKIRLMVLPVTRELSKPLFSILSLEKVNVKELAVNMPMI
ncbi:meiosis specific with OB domains hold'em [Lycorma delicatula]|uniref:meiosis specific with OB domains hold'em n=1 Tax=Lycorma delicatula TaxID=130591 RepID=UPI003F512328